MFIKVAVDEVGAVAMAAGRLVLILTGQVITATPSRNRANVSPTNPVLTPEPGTAATM